MKGFIDEFKAFAVKGNVIDLAVAVVIGAAFGKIVSSLVTNIITPIIGALMQGTSFSDMSYTFGDAVVTYGVFIQSVIDFIIVALVIFMVVKAINKAQDVFDREDEEPVVKKPVEPSEEVKLLREIRDSVKQ
jgi:large conductance mechanosensitive channel